MAFLAVDLGASRIKAAFIPDLRERAVESFFVYRPPARAVLLRHSSEGQAPAQRAAIVRPFNDTYAADALRSIFTEILRRFPEARGGSCAVAVSLGAKPRLRELVRDAGVASGLSSLRLFDDTLAALCSAKPREKSAERILTIGWGADAFSLAVYQMQPGSIQTLAQDSTRDCGGDAIDSAISEFVLSKPPDEAAAEPALAMEAMREAEKLKIAGNAIFSGTVPAPPGSTGDPLQLSREKIGAQVLGVLKRAAGRLSKVVEESKGTGPLQVRLFGGTVPLRGLQQWVEEHLALPASVLGEDCVLQGLCALYRAESPKDEEPSRLPPVQSIPVQQASGAAVEAVEPKAPADMPVAPTSPAEPAQASHAEPSISTTDTENIKRAAELRMEAIRVEAQQGASAGILLYRQARQLDPESRQIAAELARLCLQHGQEMIGKKGDIQSALHLALEGIRLLERTADAADFHKKTLGKLYQLSAICWAHCGSPDQAVTALGKAVALHPEDRRLQEEYSRLKKLMPPLVSGPGSQPEPKP